jgi:phosphopantetheine adenylyltransferase
MYLFVFLAFYVFFFVPFFFRFFNKANRLSMIKTLACAIEFSKNISQNKNVCFQRKKKKKMTQRSFVLNAKLQSVAENTTRFTDFLTSFVSVASPTTLKKTDIPVEPLRKRPVISYLTMNSKTDKKLCTKKVILQQAIAIYEASVEVNPFINTVVVPAVVSQKESESEKNDDENVRPLSSTDLLAPENKEEYNPVFEYVALGGTFDRLHPGHKMLLTEAALATTKKLRVGITGPKLLKNKKNAEMLQSFEERCQAATDFLKLLRPDLILEVVELEEKSGGTNEIAEVNAMVVSPETFPSLESINVERREKGFKDMAAIVIEFVGGESNTTRLSSSKLREMEIAAASSGTKKPEFE